MPETIAPDSKRPRAAHPVRQVATLLALWERDRMGAMAHPGEDHEAIRDMILKHRHEIRRSLDLIAPVPLGTVPRPLAAFCHLIFAREDPKRALGFFIELGGELSAGAHGAGSEEVTRKMSPPYRLARSIERNRRGGHWGLNTEELAALFFKAWLFYRIGLRTRLLKVHPGERWWDLGEGARRLAIPDAEVQP